MESKTAYRIIFLPHEFNAKIVLDSSNRQKNLIYTVNDSYYDGIGVHFRIRKKAKDFINAFLGTNFAVVYGNECIFFGNIHYILTKKFSKRIACFDLCRCVGSRSSKVHYYYVYDYVLNHISEIDNLEFSQSKIISFGSL